MGRIERRKRKTWLQFWWGVSDAVAILLAFPSAYWLRFHSPLTEIVPVVKGIPSVGPYLTAGLVMIVAWLPLFRTMGLYEVEVGRRGQKTFRVLRAAGIAVVIGAALTFFYRGFSFSRAFFPLLYVSVVIFILTGRAATGILTRRWRRKRPLRVALVGDSAGGWELAFRLQASDPTGVMLCGCFVAGRAERQVRAGGPGTEVAVPGADAVPVLGTYGEVATVVADRRIDVLVLAFPLGEQQHATEIVTTCRSLPVDIELVPDTFQLLSRRAGVRDVDGLPVLSLREFPLTGWNVVRKRAFDVAVAALAIILLSPLLLVLTILVRLGSPGPVFYRQERLGRDGRRFDILKFRSMREGAESETGPVWATRSDDRRTRVGSFMREWSLDELPQLFNVLRGEMSLVGPRPERPHFVRQFSERMPDYLDRQRVKSGMTGWAQVNGLRGDTSIEERTRYDIYYVENWSLALDVKILLMTARAVLGRGEAY